MLVETARLWPSLGHHDRHGVWHLDGVTGPDEYTAVVRDNVFTNLMAAHNLRIAAAACERHPEAARALDVTTEETAAWRDAAEAGAPPRSTTVSACTSSARGSPRCASGTSPTTPTIRCCCTSPTCGSTRPRWSSRPTWSWRCTGSGHAFTSEQKARNVDYYEPRMVRDSSLSAATQAVLCAEVGHLELAHDYAYEAALIDLRDLHHNTRDGLHMASLAGAWTALVAGFGGLRDDDGVLALDPQLARGDHPAVLSVAVEGFSHHRRRRPRRGRVLAVPGRPRTDEDTAAP